MKKNMHQTVYEPIGTEDPMVSSTAAALQQLNNKEEEKKEAAIEAAKVRCRTCFKEIAPKIRCFGHGGGGGGESAASDNASEGTANPGDDNSLIQSTNTVETEEEWRGAFDSEFLDEERFDPELIAEMIADGLLRVDIDRDSRTLTVELLCELNELTEKQGNELKKFMDAIIQEFNKFKAENNLPDHCMQVTQDNEGNILSLRITMPTLDLYDKFIERLANNLVPVPKPKIQKQDEVRAHQSSSPNPLSMEPKSIPSNTKKEMEARDEINQNKEEQNYFNPSPFKMNPW